MRLANPLLKIRQMWRAARLQMLEPQPLQHLVAKRVLPLIAIRSVAVFISAALDGRASIGFVLAIGEYGLQLGAWLAVALIASELLKIIEIELSERQSFLLAAAAFFPLWLGGIFYAAPNALFFLTLWSRTLTFLVSLAGAYLVQDLLKIYSDDLGNSESKTGKWRLQGTALIAAAALLAYSALWLVFGFVSSIILYFLG